MPKTHDTWTVLPHDPLVELDEGLLTVTGQIPMPLGNFPRRMSVIALSGQRTAIWSAISLPEPDMARIEALGAPSFLIVPNPGHRLDAKAWKARYPAITVVTPPGARAGVEEVVPVDATTDVLADPALSFRAIAGTGDTESALILTRASGTTLVTNDIIGHVRHPVGFGAKVMAWLFRYGTKEPAVPRTIMRFIKDKKALAGQLREFARLPNLKRVVVSHGDPIIDNPAGHLTRLAHFLEA